MSLCKLELSSLFGFEPRGRCWESSIGVDPSRSPFIKIQVEKMFEGENIAEIAKLAETVNLSGATFKVVFEHSDIETDYTEKRAIEREIGSHIRGKADMRTPQRYFAILYTAGRWVFGECRYNTAVWLQHMRKPQNYSTALSTRVARAAVNIAVPNPTGVKAIDPCCGMGTVVIEALSMGIDMVGYDLNPLAVRGARVNLAHYHMPNVVAVADIKHLTGSYDAAIVDMPYNLCSKLTAEDQRVLLESAHRLASKAVVISTESIIRLLEQVGFAIKVRCLIKKGRFTRHLFVCEHAADNVESDK